MKKLSDAELTVMNVLWQEGIPMRTGEIAEKKVVTTTVNKVSRFIDAVLLNNTEQRQDS